MEKPLTVEEMIAATRELVCPIAELWGVTCADISVEVQLLDFVTVRVEAIPRTDD